ncbi:hypothetical protein KDH83_18140 [Achromobacter sp. Marseille-Q0513]|uniref:hypothetical protein n=1 Tax=Achromobacter sp. Marseille-Q0513 TaxID=2829161 RepID=UPI001BA2F1BD|nr:hypothetical protein [Achromobacter sp. Marseille-Q0513]MBR8655227.1 hypothetical protein [Achromobacter sp. Marseille-Q0513]
MTITMQRQVSYDGFTIFDPQSWLPTYGNWSGPGWSAGERDSQKTEAELQASPVYIHPNGTPSLVDQISKDHDIAYLRAAGDPNEAYLIAQADIELLNRLSQLNFPALPPVEATYATFMVFTFFQKIMMIDIPRVGFDILKNKINQIIPTLRIILAGYGINGMSYSDAFGNSMTGTAFSGNTVGLVYQINSVRYTKAAGDHSSFTHYRDAYQNIYSGFNEATPYFGAYIKQWVDGTISLVDGNRQMQISSPSSQGTASIPSVGSTVDPIGGQGSGSGSDPGAARFFWNGLYKHDGRKWSYEGPDDIEAWVCVNEQFCQVFRRNQP